MDKREVEAIQRKALSGKSGVYAIFNEQAGKIYIGSSNDIWKRWEEHKRDLRNNKHDNIHLQRSWNKYGEREFSFVIMEFCDPDVRLKREQYYLDMHKDKWDLVYNIATNAKAPMEGKKGELHPWWGRHHSEETRRKLSEIHKGKIIPCSVKEKISKTLQGRIISEETKNKMSENHANYYGENNPNSKQIYIYNKYGLVKQFNAVTDCIRWLINNKYVTSNGKDIIDSIRHCIIDTIEKKKPYKNFVISYNKLTIDEINNIYNNKPNYHTNGVYMYDKEGKEYYFEMLKDCCQWFVDNGYSSQTDTVRGGVCRAIRLNKSYKGFIFSYEKLDKVS